MASSFMKHTKAMKSLIPSYTKEFGAMKYIMNV